MSIDVSQYWEMLQGLPYYPYSVIGPVILVLLLLILLLVMRKRSSSSKRRKPNRPGKTPAETPIRGKPVDGLSLDGDPIVVDTPDDSRQLVPPPPPKPPVDPALIEAAVKDCQQKFQEMYIDMYLGLGLMSDFERMRTEVTQRLADGKETYHAISELRMTPEAVVLMQMSSVAGSLLQSGEQHIGKGLLGIHGQELFSVYRYALTTMQEKGVATQAETQGKLDFIERKIQELG
ncbi:MAG: hypothetical protein LBJ22_06605 [Synergistaceae bacterium]|nr:hypothetical protein [Synergistaceae bacterium]